MLFKAQQPDHGIATRQTSGVPLGGLGAGCVELGSDGFFRNITINNNRTPGKRIPVSDASFLAFRAETETGTYARVLQRRSAAGESDGIAAFPRLHPHEYEWQGLYPKAHYVLKDPRCPATVAWGAFSPIIPFDLEASTLPAFFASVHCGNPTSTPMRVTVVFNWENLCGRTGTGTNAQLATITPKSIDEDEGIVSAPGRRVVSEKGKARILPGNALVFEMKDGEDRNADGQHCLTVRYRGDDEVSLLAWDHRDAGACQAFWRTFSEQGQLMPAAEEEAGETSGSLCLSLLLQPGEARRIDYQLSWYCPDFKVGDTDLGNHYASRFHSATDVTRQTLKNYLYFVTSVDGWQQRILSANLPPWLRYLLVNANSVFSTNSIYTFDGTFELLLSPEAAVPANPADRLYATLGTLLFFPRLEENQLFRQLEAAQPQRSRKPAVQLVPLVARDDDRNEVMETAQLVLSAYRNFVFTGSLAKIRALLPLIRPLLESVMKLDSDGDGLPEDLESALTYDGVAVQGLDALSAGLWVVSLEAISRLMRVLRRADKAAEFAERARKAAEAFERGYWDEDRGFYRLSHIRQDAQESACHPGQLAGAFFAEFLGLGPLFDPTHIERALETIAIRYPRGGVLQDCEENVWLSPAYDAVHYAGLRIMRGACLEGLGVVNNFLQHPNYPVDSFSGLPLRLPVFSGDRWQGIREPHEAGLSVWHLLFTVEGFDICMPEKRMRFSPNLPEDVGPVKLPLFLPSCLGTVEYKQDMSPIYTQTVVLNFDSPMAVETLELRVPGHVLHIDVQCASAEGDLVPEFETEPWEGGRLVRIHFNSSAQGTKLLKFLVTETEEKIHEPEPKTKEGWLRRLLPGA